SDEHHGMPGAVELRRLVADGGEDITAQLAALVRDDARAELDHGGAHGAKVMARFARRGNPGRMQSQSAKRRARVELEHHAADLDVVPRSEPSCLERPYYADRPQPALEIGERLLVRRVVPRDQPLDAHAGDAERALAGLAHLE